MDRPIGQSATTARPSEAIASAGKGAAAPKKASWRQDPKWVTAEGDRARIVADMKSEKDSNKLESLKLALQQQEELMKVLKKTLRGDVEDAKK